jgi:hypothetical protein
LRGKIHHDIDLESIEKLKNLESFYNEIKTNHRTTLNSLDPNLLKKLQDFDVKPF